MDPEALLDRARRVADQAEVFWASTWETPAIFEANRLKTVEGRESTGMAVRVLRDGRIGFSSTTRPDDLDGVLARALEMLPFGPPAVGGLPAPGPVPSVPVFDPRTEALSVEEMVHLGQGLIDALRPRWEEVVWECHITRSVSRVRLLNTRGLDLSYTKSVFSLGVEGVWVRGDDMLFVWEGWSGCSPLEEPGPLLEALHRKLSWAERTVPAPRGPVPVLFTPRGVAGALLGPLLAGFNGRNIVQGSSPLVGRLGERLLDPRLTLWDDPTQPLVPGSRPFDDEGVPSQRTPLVREGAVSSFLFDLQTAAQAGARSTGSASRSLRTLPSPSASVLVLEAGETPFDRMVADLPQALIAEGLLGAGQGNLLGGDFSANLLLGYRIEKGEIVGRVKNTVLSGNVYTVLRDLVAVGKEREWVGGSLLSPALVVGGVSLSSRGT